MSHLPSTAPASTSQGTMPSATKRTPEKATRKRVQRPVGDDVQSVISWLERHGTKANRDGMARYAIPSDKAFGVSVGSLRKHAKQLGRNHTLAAALWDTDRYEARMLACFVDEPALVTPAQMDQWCRDFDSWAICDTACFHLFDRTPHAWRKARQWATARPEFIKRAGFALLASLVGHDKAAADEAFLEFLPLIEQGAQDDRNFVKKGVNWALRTIGKRSLALNGAAVVVAKRLADATAAAPRWVGKDALRELAGSAVRERLARRHA
jgi:3-methyladenine DNA glycosylase AlkD